MLPEARRGHLKVFFFGFKKVILIFYIFTKIRCFKAYIVFMTCRYYKLLGSDLHPAHQQCPEPHPLHTDHQLLQGTGGAVTVPLAAQLIHSESLQEPHQQYNLHGNFQAYVLPFKRQTVPGLLSRRGCPIWLMD